MFRSDLQTQSKHKHGKRPHQARKVTLPNEATEKSVTLEPGPPCSVTADNNSDSLTAEFNET